MDKGADIHEQSTPADWGATEVARHAGVVRLLPVAVLVLSGDRCFRAAATMLLTRRGCSVLSAAAVEEALAQAAHAPVDVLVVELGEGPGPLLPRAREIAGGIDAVGAQAGRRVAAVGIVVVGEAEELGTAIDAETGAPAPVLDKWGPFERLFQAVCDRDRARRLVRSEGEWPPLRRLSRA